MNIKKYFPEIENFNGQIRKSLQETFIYTFNKYKKTSKRKAIIAARSEVLAEIVRTLCEDTVDTIKAKKWIL